MSPTDDEPSQESKQGVLGPRAATGRAEIKNPIKKRRTGRRIAVVIREEVQRELRFFSGPLPPPNILREYNEIVPGSADRIMTMAEKEQAHRHDIETEESTGGITLAKRGQLIGGVLAIIAVAGAIYLLAIGKRVNGLFVLGGLVATFGTAFIYDRIRSGATESPESTENKDTKPDLPVILLSIYLPIQTEMVPKRFALLANQLELV